MQTARKTPAHLPNMEKSPPTKEMIDVNNNYWSRTKQLTIGCDAMEGH